MPTNGNPAPTAATEPTVAAAPPVAAAPTIAAAPIIVAAPTIAAAPTIPAAPTNPTVPAENIIEPILEPTKLCLACSRRFHIRDLIEYMKDTPLRLKFRELMNFDVSLILSHYYY